MSKDERIIRALERIADALEYSNMTSFKKMNPSPFEKMNSGDADILDHGDEDDDGDPFSDMGHLKNE